MNLKETYNKIARDWIKDHSIDSWWMKGTDTFLSYLQPQAHILDVGCGAGEKSKYLLQKGCQVTGIDFSEEMIALAKERAHGAEFFVEDITQPLSLETTFDGVFVQAVLLHIPKKDVVSVLTHITIPLKKDGYLYIAVKELRAGEPDESILKENGYGYEYERFFSYFTTEELTQYLHILGMKIIYTDVVTSNKTKWVQIIAQK